MKLDIGCGQHKQPGFTGVDIGDFPGVDVVCPIESLSEKFDPESIDELYTRDLLEHVDDLFVALTEIYKVCKKGAKITIIVPHTTNYEFWGDPTHKRKFSAASFNFADKTISGKWGRDFYLPEVDFRIKAIRFNWWGDHYRNKGLIKRGIIGFFNRIISGLANMSPFLCERFWWVLVGGFYSIEYYLEKES